MSRQVTIPIYDGDDFERMSELRREVDIAERKAMAEQERASLDAPLRVGDNQSDEVEKAKATLQAARDAFDAFVDEAEQRAEMWVLHPIGHAEFRALLREHEPRKVDGEDGKQVTHPDDEGWEVNTETIGKALLEFVDPDDDTIRTIVAPQFDTVAAMRKRLKRLAAGEFDSMWIAALGLNNGAVADPKLLRYSPAVPRSSET